MYVFDFSVCFLTVVMLKWFVDAEVAAGAIELFTVFSPREWLFGIWTNVNCSSALTHQVPRISLSDPAPLNILHSTKVKPRTPKYKEASYIAG